MKLACTSGTCSQLFHSGELTQLEFLDFCASAFECDSIVLDVRHFPRIDDDYLAQLKKMAADLGIAIAALADDALLAAEPETMQLRIAQTVALGAPLLLSQTAPETAMSWSRQLERLNDATSLAKAANVTIGVRNVRGTFAGSVAECKRVTKETDSAWLRYALDPAAFGETGDARSLEKKAVAVYAPLDLSECDIARFVEEFGAFRGPLVLDADETRTLEAMQSATRRWRVALAQFILNRT